MKISFLLPHLQVYGGIRRVIELSNELIGMGHEVTVFHSDGSPCAWMELKAPTQSLADAFKTRHDHLIYLAYEQWSDVVKMQATKRYMYSCNLYNAKLINLPLGVLRIGGRFSHQLGKAFYIRRALTDPGAHLIANCTYIKDWIEHNLHRKADVVFGGVNKKFFYPMEMPHNPTAPVLLFLGSNKPWKGMEVINKAVDLVRNEFPGVELKSFAWKGVPQEKMAGVYNDADILVDAQYYAGWNNPVAEAMACKVPVVCGDIGPNTDIAVNNETALVVPVRSTEKYAEAILQLLNDKQLGVRLANKAYEKIASFTWTKAAEELVRILSQNNNGH